MVIVLYDIFWPPGPVNQILSFIRGAFGCLFFAMFIVKIRLHKFILNVHRRMARDVSREGKSSLVSRVSLEDTRGILISRSKSTFSQESLRAGPAGLLTGGPVMCGGSREWLTG